MSTTSETSGSRDLTLTLKRKGGTWDVQFLGKLPTKRELLKILRATKVGHDRAIKDYLRKVRQERTADAKRTATAAAGA